MAADDKSLQVLDHVTAWPKPARRIILPLLPRSCLSPTLIRAGIGLIQCDVVTSDHCVEVRNKLASKGVDPTRHLHSSCQAF